MSGWFRTVADLNPLTYLIEGARAQMITGLVWSEYLQAWSIALGIFAAGVVVANLALRGRLAERA